MLRTLSSEEDFEQAAGIIGQAFNCTLDSHNRRKETMRREWPKNRAIGFFEGEELAAVLAMFPYRIYMYGRAIPMEGIGSVAALPEYRYEGYTARLMKEALARMTYAKTPLSFLQPFSYGFYRKYGWEYAFDRQKVKVAPEAFAHLACKGDLRLATESDLPALAAIYDAHAKNFNLPAVRDAKDWQNFASANSMGKTRRGAFRRYCYIRKEGDGYIAFDPSAAEGVVEMAFASAEAAAGLAGFVGRHGKEYFHFHCDFPHGNLLRALAKEPREVEISQQPGMMARVVHGKTLLSLLPAASRGMLNLSLYDELVEENNGTFGISFAPETTVVTEREMVGAPFLRLNIREFSRLVAGGIPALSLYNAGLLPGDEAAAALWDRIFPPRPTYMNLYF